MKVILTTLVCICSVIACSQDVKHIREVYTSVNNRIDECQSDSDEFECSLYSNSILINENGNSWRAVGTYSKEITFWYNDEPAFSENEEKPEAVLEKVVVRVTSTYELYEEYLFEDGELIFYFRKFEYDDGPQESRFYFFDGELIDFKSKVPEGAQADLTRKDNEAVLEGAVKIQSLFLLSME